MTTYLLAGGGTGGHVNPLLALAERIRKADPTAEVLALGTKEGLESTLVPARGFELICVERLPFPRRVSLYALTFPLRFARAVNVIRRLISDRKVDVVVGFGGYASAPAYLAARIESIPYVVHEANALPGIANKFAARAAAAVAVTFPSTKLPNAIVTGMPLREEIENATHNTKKKVARSALGLDPNVPTLLVTGGSLGARSINHTIHDSESALHAAGIQVLQIVGSNSDLPEVQTKLLKRLKYCTQMDLAIGAADLAIARGGASTVSEFGSFGLPAVFIPYPVGNGEQKLNVQGVVQAGGALTVRDSDFTVDYVKDTVIPLISNPKRLSAMSKLAKESIISNGTARLYELVLSVLTVKPKSDK